MVYILLIIGLITLFTRRIPRGRATIWVLSILVVMLVFLWGSYFSWNNPSGDPQGGMFRGIELIILLITTVSFFFAAWFSTRPKHDGSDTKRLGVSRELLTVAVVGAVVVVGYFALIYLS